MSLDRLNLSPWDGLSLLNREAEVRDPESIRSAWADDSALLLQLDFDSQFVLDPFGIPAVAAAHPEPHQMVVPWDDEAT